MKRLLVVLLLLVFPSLAFADQPGKMTSSEKALLKIEEDLLAGILKSDWALFDRYMAPGFVFVGPDGSMQDKAQWMADAKSGALKIESSKNEDMKVRVYGDTAVVTYRSIDKGTFKGMDISGQYRWTDVFIKRAGKWQIVSTQGSPIPKK